MADGPLAGRTIAVTRPRAHAGQLVAALEELGAVAEVVPLIAIEPLDDGRLAELVAEGGHDWLVFTSANAVRAVGASLPRARGRSAAVGPATAAALRELGVEPAFVPKRFAATEIVDGLEPLEGARVLLPQSEVAEPLLAEELRARGAIVDAVDAYRTVGVTPSTDELRRLREVDAILLASGSAARALVAALPEPTALVVCIGPSTGDAARAVGLRVDLTSEEATGLGMIGALVTHFGESQ